MALGSGHEKLRRRVEEIVAGYEGKDLLDYSPARNAFPHDVLDGLSRFEQPCLVLTGARETATRREHARRLLESIPRSREIVFEHSGHLSNLTEEKRYNRTVAEFCASADADAEKREALDPDRSS